MTEAIPATAPNSAYLHAHLLGAHDKPLQAWHLEREVQAPVTNPVLDEVDQKVVLGIVKRFENSRKKNPGMEDQVDEADSDAE